MQTIFFSLLSFYNGMYFTQSARVAHNFQSNAKSRFALWFCVIAASRLSCYMYHFISNIIQFFFLASLKHAQFTHFTFYFFSLLFHFWIWFSIQSFFLQSLSDACLLSGMMKLTKCWKHLLTSKQANSFLLFSLMWRILISHLLPMTFLLFNWSKIRN